MHLGEVGAKRDHHHCILRSLKEMGGGGGGVHRQSFLDTKAEKISYLEDVFSGII